MAKRPLVLMIGFGGQHDPLAGRVLLLKFRVLRADGVEDARRLIQRGNDPLRVALLPVSHPFADLPGALAQLRAAAPEPGIEFIVVGRRPRPEQLGSFRQAGVRFGLFEAFNDGELRFLLNRTAFDGGRGESRDELRVPTRILGRVFSAAGEKPVLVYNLSTGGAYVETHRPTGVKGRIRVELPLSTDTLTLDAHVVSTNVPGNLQRANLPMGMGVRWDGLDPSQHQTILKYLTERAHSYEL